MSSDKPHRPSAKRLREARRNGQLPKSRTFTGAMSFLFGIIALFWVNRNVWVSSEMLLHWCLLSGPGGGSACAHSALRSFLGVVLPVLGAIAVGGVAAEVLQIGFQFQFHLAQPKADPVNVCKGVGRLGVSLRRSWLNVALVSLTVVIFAITLRDAPHSLSVVGSSSAAAFSSIQVVVVVGCAVVLIGGLVDLVVSRRRFIREMSMSFEEVRREHREEDGDPQIKSMRRALHRQILLSDLQRRVRRARVVVVAKS